MTDVLAVIDMQNDFVSGSLGTKEAQAIVQNAVKMIETFKGHAGYAPKFLFAISRRNVFTCSALHKKHGRVGTCCSGKKTHDRSSL